MNVGVFSCDPGGATGLMWGIFNPCAPTVEEMLKTRMEPGSCTVTGDERTQIREIADTWSAFYSACVRSALLPPERVFFVCESFIFTGSNSYGGDSAAISTALIWGIEGYRMGRADEWLKHGRGRKELHVPPMVMQSASDAKSYASKKRLRDWGCWEVGFAGKREHEFSALQHIAFFLHSHAANLA